MICPPEVSGFIQRLLAFDEYCGDDSKVALTAYFYYLERQKQGLPGSAEDDWKKAEETVMEGIINEMSVKLAQPQAI